MTRYTVDIVMTDSEGTSWNTRSRETVADWTGTAGELAQHTADHLQMSSRADLKVSDLTILVRTDTGERVAELVLPTEAPPMSPCDYEGCVSYLGHTEDGTDHITYLQATTGLDT